MDKSAIFILAHLSACLLLGASLHAQGVERVSETAAGLSVNGASLKPCISGDGQFVAYESRASNLVASDTNGDSDIFVFDRGTGTTVRVSIDSFGAQANGDSVEAAISQDGQIVAFTSYANNLVPNDTNGLSDVFVHDRSTGTTVRVSVDSSGLQANSSSSDCAISGDGRYVVFESNASNLVLSDTNGINDIFLHDRQTGITSRVSLDSFGVEGDAFSVTPAISADGTTIVFQSAATNLVPGDTNGQSDVFAHEHLTGQTSRVSVGSGGVQSLGYSYNPDVSGDGNVVLFTSDAPSLVPGDLNGTIDVFCHDRSTSQTTRVSVNSEGQGGLDWSDRGRISEDGRLVVFESYAANLVQVDQHLATDVFLHDRQLLTTTNLSFSKAGLQGNKQSGNPAISADGSLIVFDDFSANLVPSDTNFAHDIFLNDRNSYPNLTRFGTCPGPITLTASNLTPGGQVVVVHGSRGLYTHSGGPCDGLALGIASPTVGAILTADAAGELSLSFTSGAPHCLTSIQMVDLATCTASNLLSI